MQILLHTNMEWYGINFRPFLCLCYLSLQFVVAVKFYWDSNFCFGFLCYAWLERDEIKEGKTKEDAKGEGIFSKGKVERKEWDWNLYQLIPWQQWENYWDKQMEGREKFPLLPSSFPLFTKKHKWFWNPTWLCTNAALLDVILCTTFLTKQMKNWSIQILK